MVLAREIAFLHSFDSLVRKIVRRAGPLVDLSSLGHTVQLCTTCASFISTELVSIASPLQEVLPVIIAARRVEHQR